MKHRKPLFPESFLVTILRIGVGWHFLYEGLFKLFSAQWTSYDYLMNTTGFLSGFFHALAASPVLLRMVDILNIYGLILIGLALFLGWFIRLAAAGGTVLLALYYFAYPPVSFSWFWTPDTHAFIIDRNVIEAFVLVFLIFSKTKGYGIDALWHDIHVKKDPGNENDPGSTRRNKRREMIKHLAAIPFLGFLGWGAYTNRSKDADVFSGATIKVSQKTLSDLKGALPQGKIKDHVISRLVLGGNLIGGWAHSRDLSYVSSLFKAYNTERKVYETLMLAEKTGINTLNIGFASNPILARYKKHFGSHIKVISQVGPNMEKGDYFEEINKAIDFGADILQIQGNWCDWLVRDHKTEVVGKMLDHIRSQGYTAGLASHTVDALIACEQAGFLPDYYMKTMHHDNYWSAHPRENRVPFEVDGEKYLDHNKFHDNIFCLFPERTVDFVRKAQIPVMGFKVLAAGAIDPPDGFRWAFEHGADFICVGMFDFQIIDDVNLVTNLLNDLPGRERPWFG